MAARFGQGKINLLGNVMLQAPVFQLTDDENGFFSLPDLPFDAVSVLPGSQPTIH